MTILIAGVLLLALIVRAKKSNNGATGETPAKLFRPMLLNWKMRECDAFGCGHFGASRSRSGRGLATKHEGTDFIANPGAIVFAPGDGKYVRSALPYPGDERYKGLVLQLGEYEMKVFYVSPSIAPGKEIRPGEAIGLVQNLAPKYDGITNHIHVEVRKSGELINPMELF
jgi:murein DD-endopeptidase MepM/ murein hydrolase activator NlpD